MKDLQPARDSDFGCYALDWCGHRVRTRRRVLAGLRVIGVDRQSAPLESARTANLIDRSYRKVGGLHASAPLPCAKSFFGVRRDAARVRADVEMRIMPRGSLGDYIERLRDSVENYERGIPICLAARTSSTFESQGSIERAEE